MQALPTGTVTLLFTDIEGSTRLLQELGARYVDALETHRRLIRAAAAACDGAEVDTQGDAFLIAFSRASDAVGAATQAQRALAETPVRVRMGIHTGEPTQTREGYVGVDLHRGARVMAAAHGGQVLLSGATRDLVPETPARDLGEHRLKDLTQPQRLYQLIADGLELDFPPPRTLDDHPSNLPVQPTALVGREREVAELLELVRRPDVHVLTLTGPGGAGKTRLALQAAAELLEDFPHGAWFVNLASLTDAGLVLPTIASTLGVRNQAGEAIGETLAEQLRDQQLLLVLDNFEHVLAAASEVARLAAAARGIALLVTSRAALRVSAEREYAVPALSTSEALALFVDRAQAARASFTLDRNQPLLEEICRRLDNLPLAIELAAARVKVLSEAALLDRLSERLRLLAGGARDAPERQQTLQATIAWSYDLLAEADRRLFRRLAVFSGGRTLAAMEGVCNSDDELDVFEGVASLVDNSLLRREEQLDDEPRFVMLETIHEYARARLDESDEADIAWRRHALYFTEVVEAAAAQLHGPEQQRAFERIAREFGNVRAALGWALEREPELAIRLAASLGPFYRYMGQAGEGQRRLVRAAHAARDAPPALRGRTLEWAGRLSVLVGDPVTAAQLAREAVAAFQEAGDPLELAGALGGLSEAERIRGNFEEARTRAEQAVAAARASGSDEATAGALNSLSMVLAATDPARALALLEEALELARRSGDPQRIAGFLGNLGVLLLERGDHEAAGPIIAEELEIARAAGNRTQATIAVVNLGLVSVGAHDPAAAEPLLREGVEGCRQLDSALGLCYCLEGFAGIAALTARPERAVRLFAAADSARERLATRLSPPELARNEQFLASAREALTDQAFRAERARGSAMALGEAIEYALAE
jgi:predicted ATPase/class 3 adenylate cyclase